MGKVIPTLTNTTYITRIFASKLPQKYLKTASKLGMTGLLMLGLQLAVQGGGWRKCNVVTWIERKVSSD